MHFFLGALRVNKDMFCSVWFLSLSLLMEMLTDRQQTDCYIPNLVSLGIAISPNLIGRGIKMLFAVILMQLFMAKQSKYSIQIL